MISHAVADAASLMRVAVLDDDIRFIRMVERILQHEQMSIQPITTMDIDEALGVITATRCDAAIIDVYMYGSQLGFTLVEHLRAHPATANLPIVVASGARREIGKRVDFLQAHRCGVLLKPFEIDELVLKLAAAVETEQEAPSVRVPSPGLGGALHRVTTALHGGS